MQKYHSLYDLKLRKEYTFSNHLALTSELFSSNSFIQKKIIYLYAIALRVRILALSVWSYGYFWCLPFHIHILLINNNWTFNLHVDTQLSISEWNINCQWCRLGSLFLSIIAISHSWQSLAYTFFQFCIGFIKEIINVKA